jgi:4-hydroxy-tetrahydrodipicolinate synthase
MREPVFTGACVAIVTPFTADNQVDFDQFGQLIELQIAAGTDAICVCGTTGESATQSIEEHMNTVEYCIKKVAGRCKVIAGAGSNDTACALDLALHAEAAGADGLLMVTPYYNKATQAGLIKHYEYVADRVHTPIILYNVPSRTGCSFTAATYEKLSKHPNICGVKEASGNFSLVTETRRRCGDDFYIWSGNDDQVVPMMSLGAKGVISVVSNIQPEFMVKMTHLCLEGKFEEAAKLQISSIDLVNALFMEVNPIPVKAAMEMMGLCSGQLRLPLCEMSVEHLVALREVLTAHGIALKD